MRGKRSARRRWTWILRDLDRQSIAASVLVGCLALVSGVGWFGLSPFATSSFETWAREETSSSESSRNSEPHPLPLFQLDVRSAPWPEWALLPGLGETMAKRICDHRERHGGFRTPDDVRRVRGVGPKTWERIRPYLYAATDAPASAPPSRPERTSGKGT